MQNGLYIEKVCLKKLKLLRKKFKTLRKRFQTVILEMLEDYFLKKEHKKCISEIKERPDTQLQYYIPEYSIKY